MQEQLKALTDWCSKALKVFGDILFWVVWIGVMFLIFRKEGDVGSESVREGKWAGPVVIVASLWAVIWHFANRLSTEVQANSWMLQRVREELKELNGDVTELNQESWDR